MYIRELVFVICYCLTLTAYAEDRFITGTIKIFSVNSKIEISAWAEVGLDQGESVKYISKKPANWKILLKASSGKVLATRNLVFENGIVDYTSTFGIQNTPEEKKALKEREGPYDYASFSFPFYKGAKSVELLFKGKVKAVAVVDLQ